MQEPSPSQGTCGWKAPSTIVRVPPGALRMGGAGGGPGPASLPACEPHGCPALLPASLNNVNQSKSLFLLVLNPQPLPSLPSAKIKTSHGWACSLGANRGAGAAGQHRAGRRGCRGHWLSYKLACARFQGECTLPALFKAPSEQRPRSDGAPEFPVNAVCIPGCVTALAWPGLGMSASLSGSPRLPGQSILDEATSPASPPGPAGRQMEKSPWGAPHPPLTASLWFWSSVPSASGLLFDLCLRQTPAQ